ncbi:MAG TPA: alpha-amylase family glycosyl hydrolase, partial [Luteimonas sp.]
FAMIDRFDDGDPSNNDQGAGEYDPTDPSRYSGGDLAGLARRIDYIQGLGATALWITPPVANQWLNPDGSYSGYHGYWAEDFDRIDAHYGTLDDYRALSRRLHGAGMYLVQDVVVNHMGDWLQCTPAADVAATDPVRDCRVRRDPRGHSAPVQAPFDRNDPADPAQRAAGIYHWTPDIADFTDRRQELDFALAGLDDLDTENPAVRRALRASYGRWIREAGVDAFRVDTAFHVPEAFFADFLHSDDADAPGIERVARETGRDGFLAFGEGFGSDRPYGDAQARKLEAYVRTPGGLPSMINFPLYGGFGDVFARGRPTAELAHRIEAMMVIHRDPHRMPTFVDNHDVDRFLAGGSEPALRQALLAMLALPGIPVIWQGTEQGFERQRRAMFAGGYDSGGRDHFDVEAPLYRYLQRAIALRRDHRLFSRGTPTVLASNAAAAGAIAWRMDHADEAALVVLNTADVPVLLDNIAPGLVAGARLEGLFAIDGAPAEAVADAAGRLTLVLPPRSGQVWRLPAGTRDTAEGGPSTASTAGLHVEPLADAVQRGDFTVRGRAPGRRRVQVVVDGDLASAQDVAVGPDGRWAARVRTGGMIGPTAMHRVVAFDPADGQASAAREFRVEHDWRLLADVADPPGDDSGPDGRYTYPAGGAWRTLRPADILRVRAWGASGALRVELTMRALSQAWNPANGFDHVAITGYLQLPGRDGGLAAMPLQNASLPGGMRWHYRLRSHGWSNLLSSTEGASPASEGATVMPAADIAVDRARNTLTFTLAASALGGPDTLEGARLYLTTWDYDAGYRPLHPEAGPHAFGGGDGATDPLVMDSVDVTLGRR